MHRHSENYPLVGLAGGGMTSLEDERSSLSKTLEGRQLAVWSAVSSTNYTVFAGLYSVGSWSTLDLDPSTVARGGAMILLGTMPLLFLSLWEWCFTGEGGGTHAQDARMMCFLNSAGAFFMTIGNWYKFSFSNNEAIRTQFGNWVVVYGSLMLACGKFWRAIDFPYLENKAGVKSSMTDCLVGSGMLFTALKCLIASLQNEESMAESGPEMNIYLTVPACLCFLLAAITSAYYNYCVVVKE